MALAGHAVPCRAMPGPDRPGQGWPGRHLSGNYSYLIWGVLIGLVRQGWALAKNNTHYLQLILSLLLQSVG